MKTKFYRILSFIMLSCLLVCGVPISAEGAARSKDIAVLYTGDVHCAIDENIGYAGLSAFKKQLISENCEVILADSGDAIQGAMIGSYSKGESIIKLMNKLGYSAMTLGNHEFDYGGVERVSELSKISDFPFLSSNFTDKRTGKPIYDPYTIVERDGVKIAFVGVTTPNTLTSSTPTYFMNKNGELIYDFMLDGTGKQLWANVQKSVDSAKSAGADYVIALTHLGIYEGIYSSNSLIANTTGIDAVLDGHSHSVVECARVKNKNGDRVLLTATGTKLEHIGFLLIDRRGNLSTGLVSDVPDRDEDVTKLIGELQKEYKEEMDKVAVHINNALIVNDPETDVRIVRNAETNLGDLCADAYRAAGDADIAFINGGGIRAPLSSGDITYGEILAVNPFGNLLSKMEISGQAILDALEVGAKIVPEESGGFLQVSGLTYEIDTDIPSCVVMDDNGMFVSVNGKYRVHNVKIGGKPLDTNQKYTVVSIGYILKDFGNGYTMFTSGKLLMDDFMLDSDALIEYINTEYKKNPDKYSDPYGEGRIIEAKNSDSGIN